MAPLWAPLVVLIGISAPTKERISLVVMDPLCRRLACPCVKGYAQRDYEALGRYLTKETGLAVKVTYAEDLARVIDSSSTGGVDLIVGKNSLVKFDAKECGISVHPISMLTGKDGKTTLMGLFVVRKDDPARTLRDLKGREIFFGTSDAVEKHQGAIDALRALGFELPAKLKEYAGCSDAALAVLGSNLEPPPAGVISSYAAALIEGCGTVPRGSLRVVGQTKPFPFVTVFATDHLKKAWEQRCLKAMLRMRKNAKLLKIMESKAGFVPIPAQTANASESWPDWRGPRRDGTVAWLPERLPHSPRLVWSQQLARPGLAGVSVANGRVVVADRDPQDVSDVFRCFGMKDGRPLWKVVDRSPGRLDYGASARATPLLFDGRAYLLGAFGNFLCVDLRTGKTLWRRNLVSDLGGERPTWGYTSTPLVVGDAVIVNPGGRDSSLVALDRHTGAVVWRSPGGASAYASFILAKPQGLSEIVGYDAESLGGWDPATGRRLWTLTPPLSGDFNVPSPSVADGRLVVSTENNGTRVYDFDASGKLVPQPRVVSDVAAQVSTPIVAGGRLLVCQGGLYCLDMKDGLRMVWSTQDPTFLEYASCFACGSRVLVSTFRGDLILLDASSRQFQPLGRIALRRDGVGSYSSPALVGSLLFLRESGRICCYDLRKESSAPRAQKPRA